MKRKAQGPKLASTSKKVRVGSGGRRIRVIGTKEIEKATATGTEPIKSDVMELGTHEGTETEKKKSEKKKKK